VTRRLPLFHRPLWPALLLAAAAFSGPLGPTAPAQDAAPEQPSQPASDPDAPASEPDRRALARKIRETVAQLQKIRAERRALQKQHENRVEELDQRIGALQRRLREVEAEAEQAQQRVDQVRDSIESGRDRAGQLRDAIAGSAEPVGKAAERIRDRVRAGIPLRRAERTDELSSIADRAASDGATGRAGAIDDFFSFLGEELQRAGERKQWNEPVRLEGGDRRVQAYQIRVGLVSQMFVGEDGRTLGLAAKRADPPWRTGLNADVERQIRTALEILQQRRPPTGETTRAPSEGAHAAEGEEG
jgi:TolA-binding protein